MLPAPSRQRMPERNRGFDTPHAPRAQPPAPTASNATADTSHRRDPSTRPPRQPHPRVLPNRRLRSDTNNGALHGFRLIGATCPAGQRAVGGGGGWVTGSSADAVGFGVVSGSRPTPPTAGTDTENGWEVYGTDDAHPIDRRLMVIAICIAT
jgi:hypothetical protein